jgi:glyoxylase-like metal-dependent hydrolase (beta-lactamase superfamily II)
MRKLFSRRSFALPAMCFAAITAALAQQAPPAPGPPPNLVKVQNDLFIVQNQANTLGDLIAYGGNATAYVTDAGVILIDSKSDREHDDLIAKLKSVTDKPIKYVILTHNHADHAEGAANADRANMVRAGDKYVPDFGYIGQAQVTLGGKRAELRQFRGHTRGDTVVYLPAARTILLGDLLTTADTIPMIVNYGDGGSWTDWTISIDEILKMDFDNVVPGHGSMIGKQRLVEIREKFGALMARVRAMNREKKTAEEIQQALIKEFNWGTGPSLGNIAGMMIELR